MPLFANNPLETQAAFSALQLRATTAEQNAAILRATIDNLTTAQQTIQKSDDTLARFTVSQVGANAQLTANLVAQASNTPPDLTLDSFIAALGLSVALAEASMPDRVINGVSATVPTYLTFITGADGIGRLGLRLYQPEFGSPGAIATTSFQLAKVAVDSNLPAPRSLYLVLQDKQALFSDPFWAKFASGTPPVPLASQIIVEITKVFNACGQWTFPFLLQAATILAGLETTLSTLIGNAAPPASSTAYTAAVTALSQTCQALDPSTRSDYVAGDLFALTAALDLSTRTASALQS